MPKRRMRHGIALSARSDMGFECPMLRRNIDGEDRRTGRLSSLFYILPMVECRYRVSLAQKGTIYYWDSVAACCGALFYYFAEIK